MVLEKRRVIYRESPQGASQGGRRENVYIRAEIGVGIADIIYMEENETVRGILAVGC